MWRGFLFRVAHRTYGTWLNLSTGNDVPDQSIMARTVRTLYRDRGSKQVLGIARARTFSRHVCLPSLLSARRKTFLRKSKLWLIQARRFPFVGQQVSHPRVFASTKEQWAPKTIGNRTKTCFHRQRRIEAGEVRAMQNPSDISNNRGTKKIRIEAYRRTKLKSVIEKNELSGCFLQIASCNVINTVTAFDLASLCYRQCVGHADALTSTTNLCISLHFSCFLA